VDYGVDAPVAVRNLILAAAAGLLAWAVTATGLWSGLLVLGPLVFPLGRIGLVTALACGGMALWMVWDSKTGKVRDREKLLDLLPWTGREQVLDVGCGRGLMLIGAAKRLTTGKAMGIDLWQAEDLSGNRPEATRENGRREGVTDRIEVVTGDMRDLPFPDASFDVVLSMNAIHNLYAAKDREKAISEITRVLKPGGRVLIVDIRHRRQYDTALRAGGCTEMRQVGGAVFSLFTGVLTLGLVLPTMVLGQKSGAADRRA
jgi:ubiquinone/menaquinone biosynthesis C-methylase UbiE